VTAALSDHLSKQAEACEALGSPFTARLLRVVRDNLSPGTAVADRLLTWPEATLRADAVGLRLTGGLHALVLSDAAPQLAALYPASEEDAALWSAIADAFETHSAHLLHWLDSAPQTNEVRRAPAMILAASEAAKQFPGLPLRVSELGASAGLNLLFDRFALDLPQGPYTPPNAVMTLRPDWQGRPADVAPFSVAERRGVDSNPLSTDQPADMLRLRSYLWADQPERMQRTNAALSIATPMVDAGDAGHWLAERLTTPRPGTLEFVYHTVAWQYFPETTKAACTKALTIAAARATPETPLAYLTFEMDATGPAGPGAPVRLRLWPGDIQIDLGRMDFHGRWFQIN